MLGHNRLNAIRWRLSKLSWQWNAITSVLGVRRGLWICTAKVFGLKDEFSTISPQPGKSLRARLNKSDLFVYYQIFVEDEYRPLLDLEIEGLIIDCGANVGYSSTYFLEHFPKSNVIAIEPEPSNFLMLESNLEPFRSRVKTRKAGVWSKSAPLKISTKRYRDGKAWAKQVEECDPGEADVHAVSVGDILRDSGQERIALLKMDIEGAEVEVFREKPEWLSMVDVIAIELHDDSDFGNGSIAFHQAIKDEGFRIFESGELTICVREI